MKDIIPFRQLPFPAKLAIEYLDCQDHGKRTIALLDKYIDHYYKVHNQECDAEIRQSCHVIAKDKHRMEGDALIGFIDDSVASTQLSQ